jgi:hypothetical protein
MANSDFFYGTEFTEKSFYNNMLANSIALENHFGELLFRNDLNRIIYSPNEFCFKERLRITQTDLQIPFMNYYIKQSGVTNETSPRSLWNNVNQVHGMLGSYQEILGFAIKAIPITFQYEATVFYSQPFDTLYAQQRLNMQQANETILYTYYNVPHAVVSGYDSVQLKVPIFVNYQPEYNPEYDQNDWLEKNQMFTIGIDMEVIGFFLYSDETDIALSNELILNYVASKDALDPDIDPVDINPQELIKVIMNYDPATGTSTFSDTET